jgi:hypothetical protein
MLLKVTDTNPWYANIMNFMVSGYVPPGKNKRKLQAEGSVTFGMTHTYIGYALTAC